MKLTLTVYVQPGAKRTQVQGMHGEHIKISLNAPPVDGQANDALIAWLAKKIGLKNRQLTIVRGEKSRVKTIAIDLLSESHLTQDHLINLLLKTN